MEINIEKYTEKLRKFKYILLNEYTEGYQKRQLKKLTSLSLECISKNSSVKKKFNFLKENLKEKTESKAQTTHKSTRRSSKLKNKRKFSKNYSRRIMKYFSFGLSSLWTQITLIIFFFLIIHMVFYFVFSTRAKRITNLSKVYNLSLETWNHYFILHTAVIQTLFYNNSFSMWGEEKKTYEFYYDYKKHVKEHVIENITESLDYDLGDFTEKYRSVMTTVKFF